MRHGEATISGTISHDVVDAGLVSVADGGSDTAKIWLMMHLALHLIS